MSKLNALKIRRPQGRGGSSPPPGTREMLEHFYFRCLQRSVAHRGSSPEKTTLHYSGPFLLEQFAYLGVLRSHVYIEARVVAGNVALN